MRPVTIVKSSVYQIAISQFCLTTRTALLLRGIRWLIPKEPTSAEFFKIIFLVTPTIPKAYSDLLAGRLKLGPKM